MALQQVDDAHDVSIRVFEPSVDARRQLIDDVATVYAAALPPDQRDDRFDDWRPGDDLVAAVATAGDGEPIAYLGGSLDGHRVQLDALVAASPTEPDPAVAADVLVALHEALHPSIAATGADRLELWAHPERPWHGLAARALHMTDLRALHQLRCRLPVADEALPTRPFQPGRDEEALLRVNNRAFADHPDQGGMTIDDLAEASTQPWFEPDGIRLYDDPDHPDRLAGFCWTKIHPPVADGEPALGEIYAIGVDPDHHGKGLGRPMTAAGLAWLAQQGLEVGMLYVEADNEPAIKTYARLGFENHRTDRAWWRSVDGR